MRRCPLAWARGVRCVAVRTDDGSVAAAPAVAALRGSRRRPDLAATLDPDDPALRGRRCRCESRPAARPPAPGLRLACARCSGGCTPLGAGLAPAQFLALPRSSPRPLAP